MSCVTSQKKTDLMTNKQHCFLYVFFWVFPRRPIMKYTSYFTSSPWRWNWWTVPKRRQTKIGRRGNIQKNTYKIQNMAKVWNQETLFLIKSFSAQPLTSEARFDSTPVRVRSVVKYLQWDSSSSRTSVLCCRYHFAEATHSSSATSSSYQDDGVEPENLKKKQCSFGSQ